jgi:hypothetical protein
MLRRRGVVEGSGVEDLVGVQNLVRRPGVRVLVDRPEGADESRRSCRCEVYIGREGGGALPIL